MAAPPPPPPFAAAHSAAPALPPGWQQYTTQEGRIYWANAATGQSSYTPPSAPPPLPAGFSSAIVAAPPPPLPAIAGPSTSQPAPAVEQGKKKSKAKTKVPIEGTKWLIVTTNDGNVFYSHSETKQSSWTVPDEITAHLEAQKRKEGLAKAGAVPKALPAPKPARAGEDEGEEDGGMDEMEELTPEAAAELAAIRAAMDAQRGVATKKRPSEAEDDKKKKRKKPKVVHSLEEVDEEFQKEIADELAAEAEREERGEPPVEEAPKPSTSDLTSEENKALFKSMLADVDINPFAPWEDELPKFVNDGRYKSVPRLIEKRELFEDFCKDKVREQRAKKKDTKQDPQQAFRQLLIAEVTSTRAHWEDFRRAHKKDSRFRGFGRDDREREKAFRNWLRDLGEMKRADARRHEEFFFELLKEQKDIKSTSQWSEIKRKISNDPRYDNVGSSSLREVLFTRYLAELDSVGDSAEVEKAKKEARRQQSLRERQEQVSREREVVERAAGRSRQEASREEGERELRSLFIDSVRDHEAEWEAMLPQLQRDPRFDMGNLAPHEKRGIFDDHLETLRTKRVDALESLFATQTSALNTPFADVYPGIVDESAVMRMQVSPEQIENLFEAWQRRRRTIARNDFDAMLNDSQFIDFWFRTKKEATDKKAEEATRKALAGDDEDAASADQFDLRTLARSIDFKDLHTVLRNDKRYRQFDYDPEARESWIREHLAHLAAPNLTVHQKS